tara:strand:+ start:2109 stop:2459 length:351 start_codon:yes stop_codon:yes gene_type:complete
MLLKSDAYDACISYFSDNLNIFEEKSRNKTGQPIDEIVHDQVADMLMAFCAQQPQLTNEARLAVVAEGDRLVEDIEQILGKKWEQCATLEQQLFIEEYFLLLKNSLDSQVQHLATS